jgi:hypothetical protein
VVRKAEIVVGVSLGLFLFALLVFAIGAGLGAGLSPASYEKVLLPTLSMVGNWVAGAGALAAVYAALWIYRSQVKEADEKVDANLALILTMQAAKLTVDITSLGGRPVTVTSVALCSPHADHVFVFEGHAVHLPVTLAYGERLNLLYPEEFKHHITHYIVKYCGGKAQGLTIDVRSTVKVHQCKLGGPIEDVLQQMATRHIQAEQQVSHA